jgi:hypothetical protein
VRKEAVLAESLDVVTPHSLETELPEQVLVVIRFDEAICSFSIGVKHLHYKESGHFLYLVS